MQRELAEAIRQQSDDLREELKDLEKWEIEMAKQQEAKKHRKVPNVSSEVEPPIRGTVPSIKQAISESARQLGKQLPPEQDPINLAKEKGNEYFRLGKIDDSIHAYSSGIDLDPHSASAHVLFGNRSMCYLKQGQWQLAEKDATSCVQLNKTYAKGYYRRAVARKNLNKLKEARADLESVLALAPSDSSALEEMQVVTKLLQAERAKGTAPVAKRRIVIEEVDDEDEEEEEEKKEGPSSHAEDKARSDRAKSQMEEELERVRRAAEDSKRQEMLKQEKAMEARRRNNNRVEIVEEIEEEENEAEEAKQTTTSSPVQVTSSDTKHKDPNASAPAAPPKKQQAEPAKQAEPRKAQEHTATVRPRQKPTKESLKAPQSFTEFERIYSEIEKDDDLRTHYIRLMNPAGLPALFGSNMTPEMLLGILNSIKTFPAVTALRFLQGLSKVNRVEDLALFFNADEKKLIDDVLALVKPNCSSEKELNAIKRKLKPF